MIEPGSCSVTSFPCLCMFERLMMTDIGFLWGFIASVNVSCSTAEKVMFWVLGKQRKKKKGKRLREEDLSWQTKQPTDAVLLSDAPGLHSNPAGQWPLVRLAAASWRRTLKLILQMGSQCVFIATQGLTGTHPVPSSPKALPKNTRS